jgi:hypothetical protein
MVVLSYQHQGPNHAPIVQDISGLTYFLNSNNFTIQNTGTFARDRQCTGRNRKQLFHHCQSVIVKYQSQKECISYAPAITQLF